MNGVDARVEYIDPNLKANGCGEVAISKFLQEFRIIEGKKIQTRITRYHAQIF